MAKSGNQVTPNGNPSINGQPFSDAKHLVNGDHESKGNLTNGELPSAAISKLTMASNTRVPPTRKYQKDLQVVCGKSYETHSLEDFLNILAKHRLRHMPHKGSRRDKILRWMEYFGTQMFEFQESVDDFVSNSKDTVQLIWACCRVLLEVGEQHIKALDKIIGVFYKMSIHLSTVLRNRSLFDSNKETRNLLDVTYAELSDIIYEATITYYRRSKTETAPLKVDIDKLFGKMMDRFFLNLNGVSNTLWRWQLEQDSRYTTADIDTIRAWLSPQDRVLRLLTSDALNSRGARDEFTCEWFQTHLLNFTRSSDQLLAITGAPCSGKSVLSAWIGERLERTLDGASYAVNSITIDSSLQSEATTLGVLKRLLLFSLDQRVGSMKLYSELSAAFEVSTSSDDVSEVQDSLWLALDTAFDNHDTSDNTVIIIDNLDQMVDFNANGRSFLDRLHSAYSKHRRHVKVIITLTSKSSETAIKVPHRNFVLHPEHDLQKFISNSLASSRYFRDSSEHDKENMVQRILVNSNHSFVLAGINIKLLRKEKSHDSFMHALNHLTKSIPDGLNKLTDRLSLLTTETKMVLSFLLVSERPLTLVEIHDLLEVNLKSKKRTRRYDTEDLVRQAQPLIKIRDGIVLFPHLSIRTYLMQLSKTGGPLVPLEVAHTQLVLRCHMYYRTHVFSNDEECETDVLETSKAEILFQKYHLMEYAARYWLNHFAASPMHRNGEYEITEEFRTCFSDSVLFAKIERRCWEAQYSIMEALKMHKTALNLRKIVLTDANDESAIVVQCLINVASIYEKTSQAVEASSYYYQAYKLSSIFGSQNSIAVSCAELYLTCTESTTTTKRTEIATRREEMLLVVIAHARQQHSVVQEIHYKTCLAKLYVEIQEIALATKVYREVYEACREHYGEFHSETIIISKGLSVVLQRGSTYEDQLAFVCRMFDEAERTMEIYDSRRLMITIRLVDLYESRKDFIAAEKLLVQLWRKISVACHSTQTIIELHERKIEIALTYIRFLRRLSKYEEASGLLCGLWQEYKVREIHSEGLIFWIKTIGEELNELRILDVAIQVYSFVYSFYKRSSKVNSAVEVAIILSQLSVECDTDESSISEILTEIHSSTIEKIKTTTTITTTTVTTCQTLSSFYVRTGRWSEAKTVCHEILVKLWSGVLSKGRGKSSNLPPRDCATGAIEIAIRLAHSHMHELQFEMAEQILLNIFHSTKNHLHIHDELVSKAVHELVLYYEKIHRPERVIEVYCELTEGYSRSLGKSHSLTLKMFYQLGELCIKHGRRKEAEHYYLEIYTSLNRDSHICRAGAVEAALVLVKMKCEKSRKILELLWQTVITRTEDYNFTAEQVEEIYLSYSIILESKIKVTKEYHEFCVHKYGNHAEITIKIRLRLAEVCERDEEAIQIYEEICKETTKTTSITTVVIEAKAKLTRLFIKNSTSTEYATKVVHLYYDVFESTRSHFGCTNSTTLQRLEEMTVFYKSRNDQKLTTTIFHTLKNMIVNIICSEKDPERLFDCAIRIAKIYILQGHTKEGYELFAELRRNRNAEICGFKLNQATDRTFFVFLTTFEQSLINGAKINFSEIMAYSLTESVMYEAYTQSIRERNSAFEISLLHGAHLRLFRKSRNLDDARDSSIDDELYDLFISDLGSSIRSSSSTRYFFNLLLEEAGQTQDKINIVVAGSISGATAVRSLLEQSKFQETYDLSLCIFQFTKSHHGYHHQEVINSGVKLALYLSGRGARACPDKDPKRKQLLDLSRTILKDILEGSRNIHVDFTKIHLSEVNELVTLLGEQQNHADLEWLLAQLWDSRHKATTSWSAQSIIYIGRRLAEVRFIHGNKDSAIHLWEDICYNVRRVWGFLDPTTLQCYVLLSEFYTAVGQHEKAMAVHYDILRQEVNDDNNTSIDDARDHTRHHLELLKRAYQRLGRLDKSPEIYSNLFSEIHTSFKGDRYFDELQPITKWSTKHHGDDKGTYKIPGSWQIMVGEDERKHQNWLRRFSGVKVQQRYDISVKRTASTGLHTYFEQIK